MTYDPKCRTCNPHAPEGSHTTIVHMLAAGHVDGTAAIAYGVEKRARERLLTEAK